MRVRCVRRIQGDVGRCRGRGACDAGVVARRLFYVIHDVFDAA